MANKLNKKQLLFCKEYIVDLNASAAAIRAGYSKKGSRQSAHKLLTNAYIAEEIQNLFDKRAYKTEITAERVLRELAAISFIDFKDMFDENGTMLEILEMPENIRRSIGGIIVTSNTGKDAQEFITKNIKIIDKRGSLELIGRHLAMFTDKIKVSKDELVEI